MGFNSNHIMEPMPQNPFKQAEADATPGNGKQVTDNQAEPVLPDSNQQTSASDKQAAGKHDYGENRDTNPVFQIN